MAAKKTGKSNEGENLAQKILGFLSRNPLSALLMLAIYAAGAWTVAVRPTAPAYEPLKNSFTMFALALQGFLLVAMIAAYLLHRWWITGKTNASSLAWGISFAFYSVIFLGLMLEALDVSWANSKNPIVFFWFRQFMIVWIAGMYYGTSRILFRSEPAHWLPTLAIIIAGYSWFYHGLLQVGDIEYTMYGFLFFLLIPLCFALACLFRLYSKRTGRLSAKLLSIGFCGIGATYAAWAPWHQNFMYFIAFAVFNLSLVPILAGFLLIPREQAV